MMIYSNVLQVLIVCRSTCHFNVDAMNDFEVRWSLGHKGEQPPYAAKLPDDIHVHSGGRQYLSPWNWR